MRHADPADLEERRCQLSDPIAIGVIAMGAIIAGTLRGRDDCKDCLSH